MTERPSGPNQLVLQATCAVKVRGATKGTGWLFNENGYLFTVGHIFKSNQTDLGDDLKIQFEDEEPTIAKIEYFLYEPNNAVDFAILKIANWNSTERHPLHISTSKNFEAEEGIISYGFGRTLITKSPASGKFVGWIENEQMVIESEHLREEGYSGAPIYHMREDAVIGLQIRMIKDSTAHTHKNTVYAMPLCKIAGFLNPDMKALLKTYDSPQTSVRLEDDIMEILYTEAQKYPGKPYLPFTDLMREIAKIDRHKYKLIDNKAFMYQVVSELHDLEDRRQLIKTLSNDSGGVTECEISDIGMSHMVKYKRKPSIMSVETFSQFPKDLDDLLLKDKTCENFVKRLSEIQEIMDYFVKQNTSLNRAVVSVYCHNDTNKSDFIEIFRKASLPQFIPIFPNVHECELKELDSFLYDFLDRIAGEYNALRPVNSRIDHPSESLFTDGNGLEEFHKYWAMIQAKFNGVPIILIIDIDEIDAVSGVDSKIVEFLIRSINELSSAHFLLIGSEDIQRDERIRELFETGFLIDIRVLADGTAKKIIELLGRYISITQDVSNAILRFCDDQPLFVINTFEKLIQVIRKSPDRVLDEDMIDDILRELVDEMNLQLTAIYRGLSKNEKIVLWVSGQTPKETKQLYSISDLPELAQLANKEYNEFRLIWKQAMDAFLGRRWIEQTSAVQVRFKQGIMLDWMSKRYSGLEQDVRE